MKRFSTVRDTQKVSLSYIEKRRGRRETEVIRRRGGNQKGREQKMAEESDGETIPLCPPQIHQKNILMLSKFHKTTSECWQRTSGTQKRSPLSLKRGRKKI